MEHLKKTAVAFFISFALVFAFARFFASGVFRKIELQYYQPAMIAQIDKQLSSVSEEFSTYRRSLYLRFLDFVELPSVKNAVLLDQSEIDIFERSRAFSDLQRAVPGVLGVRIVDENGYKIHYSTFPDDKMRQTDEFLSYFNYPSSDFEYDSVSRWENEKPAMFFDGEHDEFIFAYPFFDAFALYRGSILFYVNVSDFAEKLVVTKDAGVSDRISLVGVQSASSQKSVCGIVFNVPSLGCEDYLQNISAIWERGISTHQTISDSNGEERLLFAHRDEFCWTGAMYPKSIFVISQSARLVLLLAIFVCVYIFVFLLLNLRRDPMLAIKNEMSRLQADILHEFVGNVNKVSWETMAREVRVRKFDVARQLKKKLTRGQLARYELQIDKFVDESWENLLGLVERGKMHFAETSFGDDTFEAAVAERVKRLAKQKKHGDESECKADAPAAKKNGVVIFTGLDEWQKSDEHSPSVETSEAEESAKTPAAETAAEAKTETSEHAVAEDETPAEKPAAEIVPSSKRGDDVPAPKTSAASVEKSTADILAATEKLAASIVKATEMISKLSQAAVSKSKVAKKKSSAKTSRPTSAKTAKKMSAKISRTDVQAKNCEKFSLPSAEKRPTMEWLLQDAKKRLSAANATRVVRKRNETASESSFSDLLRDEKIAKKKRKTIDKNPSFDNNAASAKSKVSGDCSGFVVDRTLVASLSDGFDGAFSRFDDVPF